MADEIKKLHYFTGELLVQEDFTAEQAYHTSMRRRHNRLCHGFGVVQGLEVTKTGDQQVSISAGMAIDGQGREVVLVNDVTYPITLKSANRYLTIAYAENFDNADRSHQDGVSDFTRVTERPLLHDSADVPPDDGSVILLARISLLDSGAVNTIDRSASPVAAVSSIARGAIKPAQLAANSVTPDAIAPRAVTQGKLDNGSVTRDAIAENAVTREKIGPGALTFSAFTITAAPDLSAPPLSYSISASQTSKEFPSTPLVFDASAPQFLLVNVIPDDGSEGVRWMPVVRRGQGVNKVAYSVRLFPAVDGVAVTGKIRIFAIALPAG